MPAADERGAHAPQPALTTAEELTAPPATEPELKEAVADLDAAPIAAPPAPASPPEQANAPPPQTAAPPAEEPPRRRRSTVREPAPIPDNQEASQPALTPPPPPAPQPVITELGESEHTNRPRRSGWWSRRSAGG